MAAYADSARPPRWDFSVPLGPGSKPFFAPQAKGGHLFGNALSVFFFSVLQYLVPFSYLGVSGLSGFFLLFLWVILLLLLE